MDALYAIAPDGIVIEVVAHDSEFTPPEGWYEVEEGEVDCGYMTPDNGQTWIPGDPPPPAVEITAGQVTSASQVLQQLLDPSTPSPSVPDALNALAVLVASSPTVSDSTAVLVPS